jgi:hypothetical protein
MNETPTQPVMECPGCHRFIPIDFGIDLPPVDGVTGVVLQKHNCWYQRSDS